MSNLRLFHDLDTRDYSSLTSTPAAVSSMPIGNLLLAGRARKTRWLATAVTIQFAWNGGRIVDSVAAIRGNFSSATTWRLKLWADAAKTLLVYDSGDNPIYPRFGWGELTWGIDAVGRSVYDGWPLKFGTYQFAPVSAVAGELSINDAASEDGYLEMSRLILGLSYSPDHNADSIAVNWSDDGKQIRTAGGSLVTTAAVEPYRIGELSYSSLPSSDRTALTELARRIGSREDFFVLMWDQATDAALLRDGAIHAKFTAPPRAIHKAREAFDVPTLTLQEC